MDQPFEDLDLTELSLLVRTRAVTPTELCEASLSRIANTENMLHAFSYLDADAARASAQRLTEELKDGKLRGPFHGIPVGIKDEFDVKGMPTGMRDLDVPRTELADATCVARLRAGGAIIMGKTHMPIHANLPPTRNPYNQNFSAGGSSSGSGAAVSAGMVPVAMAEQTGGSTLRPASFCGVAGIKPTAGVISRFGCFPFSFTVDTVGIIGRSMADLALTLSIVAGFDPLDPKSLKDDPPSADLELHDFAPPRIAVVRNFFQERAEPEMLAAVEAAAVRFREGGAKVTELFLPDEFGLAWPCQRIIADTESATFNADQHEIRDLGGIAGRAGALLPASYYIHASRIRTWLRILTEDSLAGIDAILMPSANGTAPEGFGTGDPYLLAPWSLLGFPAVSLPYCLSKNGLPLGLQLVSVPRTDHHLLRVAAWCERVVGRMKAPVFS